jgi:hypothetical protein
MYKKDPGLNPKQPASGWKKKFNNAHGLHLLTSSACMCVYITINTYISQADFLPKQRQSLDNRGKNKRGTEEKLVE